MRRGKGPTTGETGKRGEDLAARYLADRGLRLVARNFRGQRGEIDLIMQDGPYMVFVEVRLRGRTDYGSGAESVTPAKQRRLVATAWQYLQAHGATSQAARFDVISIGWDGRHDRVEWFKDAFQA